MALKRWADFSGRASRTEYWMFQLVNNIISLILLGIGFGIVLALGIPETGSVDMLTLAIMSLCLIYSLVVFVPALALTVRRLHDVDMTGWLFLIAFVPFGSIILLVLACLPSKLYTNKYGPVPENVARDAMYNRDMT